MWDDVLCGDTRWLELRALYFFGHLGHGRWPCNISGDMMERRERKCDH